MRFRNVFGDRFIPGIGAVGPGEEFDCPPDLALSLAGQVDNYEPVDVEAHSMRTIATSPFFAEQADNGAQPDAPAETPEV